MDLQVVKIMDSEDYILFEDVGLKYNSESVLFGNLNFSIKKNSFNLLLGPTGSGKTSILRIIKGIIPYLAQFSLDGSILINNEIRTEQNFFKLGIDVGYLFQDFNLQFIGSTVEQELIFGLENMGQPREVINERLNWFLNKYPFLRKILQRNPHTLSGGELAQVVFISTIITDPETLLLDEPLANLDSKSRDTFLELLTSYKGKKTIIVASHDIKPFINLADKFLVISNDKQSLTEYNSTKSLFQNIDLYPWMNLSHLAITYYLR